MTENARIGVALPAGAESADNIVTETVALAREARDAGLAAVWLSQRFDTDALTLAAVVGHAVPGLQVGTSVVPVPHRHPLVVAGQAQTAQAASAGRFVLGIGLGAPALVTAAYGSAPQRPIAHLREYLDVLHDVFATGTVDHVGETVTARPPRSARVVGADPVPVLVAAMGPQALQAAGERADGTLPFLAGPRTLESYLVPRIAAAAQSAGRGAPRVVVALAAVVTADVDAARALAREQLSFYDTIPSYRAVLDREGVAHAAELAVIGDERTLARAVRSYLDAGATEIVLTQTGLAGDAARVATWRAAGALG
ncbi:F420-dependent oxidoreductase, MSMEG_4879 family [Jatrophihabitans endophyticus]|uniref:F420-dependent oxidoreductase, MSMEG_4879 family n=1 Tax=Jatrophihabitans endophyticus TaxID=1206085 RepID=A0A1M5LS20_9ACTN|nr:TIGR03564 family F420-dependent LLM class oxidoreductase [Jatrophihabitans endophyticus]SHG67942.1 F420-dependent oxidoreductase, MSMEG_4879 family [Jatrophihabitans endophyticus]